MSHQNHRQQKAGEEDGAECGKEHSLEREEIAPEPSKPGTKTQSKKQPKSAIHISFPPRVP
jgi:hypothetical protein